MKNDLILNFDILSVFLKRSSFQFRAQYMFFDKNHSFELKISTTVSEQFFPRR